MIIQFFHEQLRKNGLNDVLTFVKKTDLYEDGQEREDFRNGYPNKDDTEGFLAMYTE